MKTLFIIDANSLIHRAYHALPPFTSPAGKPVGALYGVAKILLKILREKNPDYIAAAFDRPEPTFRHHQFDEYKGTRTKAADELIYQLQEARNTFKIFGIKFFELAGWEADDIIVTLAKKFAKEGEVKVTMFSGDMDLAQIVEGNTIVLETPKKGINDPVLYNEQAVITRFDLPPVKLADYKGLVGETSDNIPGVEGIGPKTAVELIKKYGSLEEMYKEIDELGMSNLKIMKKLVDNREIALKSKMLATLRVDVPVETSLEDLKQTSLDLNAIKAYFNDLGFDSLIAKIS